MTAQEIIERLKYLIASNKGFNREHRDEALRLVDSLPIKECEENPTIQEQPVKTNIVEDLKHYLATTPKEQIKKDWESLKEWDKVGPSVSEFLGWEQPVCEEFEEEFIRYIHEKDAEVSERGESTYTQEDLEDIASHFAKWQKEEDTKKHHQEWMDWKEVLFDEIKKAETRGYHKGVEDGIIVGKEQMMKDGLDKIVHLEWGKKKIEVYDAELEGLKFGDKVKLIIIKEDTK